MAILASLVLAAADLIAAIRAGATERLVRIPGVGKKLAERLVVELKDKLDHFAVAPVQPSVQGAAVDDVLSALVNLGYQEAQGKRIFYLYCVWCHADATPAGPSNRGNLTPVPPLLNDGEKLNGESDEFMQNIITLGGSALGKSAMMPPYGKTLSAGEIQAVIAFTRAIAQPPYQRPGRPGSQYTAK